MTWIEKKLKKASIRTVDVPDEVRTHDLPNTSLRPLSLYPNPHEKKIILDSIDTEFGQNLSVMVYAEWSGAMWRKHVTKLGASRDREIP